MLDTTCVRCCGDHCYTWRVALQTGLAVVTLTALVMTILGGLSFYDKTQLLATPGNWAATIGGGVAFVGFGAGFIWARHLAINRRRMMDTMFYVNPGYQTKTEIPFSPEGVKQVLTDLGISQEPGDTVSNPLLLDFLCKLGVLKKTRDSSYDLLKFERTEKTRQEIEQQLQQITDWQHRQRVTPFPVEQTQKYTDYFYRAVPQESAFPIGDDSYKSKRKRETGQDFFMNAVGLLFGRNSPLIITPTPIQGRLIDNTEDIWKLLWESNATVVVDLTNDLDRCPRYYPSFLITEFEKGEFVVKASIESHNVEHIDEHGLFINRNSESKSVYVVHLDNWYSHKVKEPEQMYQLFERIEVLQQKASSISSPIIVHCPDGMGKSGTFAGLYIIYQIINDAQKNGKSYEINFDKFVRLLRMPPFGRFGAVETPEEFGLLESFAAHCLMQARKG